MNIRNETLAPDEDQIFILMANHASRTVPVYKSGLTIGSEPDNDIVLDDPTVGQYHARIEQENGHYRIIDLNSISGTFLGDQRLHPGEPVQWSPEQTVRIGENWLGLRKAGEVQTEIAATQPILPEIDPDLIRWGVGKQIGVYAPTEQLSIAPGRSGSTVVVLFNQGAEETRLRFKVSGVPLNWLGAMPAIVTIPSKSERQVNLVFQLPEAPTTRIGRHVVTVQVIEQDLPIEQVEFTLTLTVLAYSRFACKLYPETHDPEKPAQLKIENLGNMPETFFITTSDPSGKLAIELSSDQAQIAEGQAALIDVRVTRPLDLFSTKERPYLFMIQVRSSAGQVQVIDTSVMSKGVIPIWLVPIFMLILLGLCIGMVWAAGGGLADMTATPTINPIVGVIDTDGDGISDVDEIVLGTDPMLPDTDGDDLGDGDEQRYGSNPLVIDTDGDTLTDGQEVLVLLTSPINPDTDGDGLNDNVDPDPGQLPTFTPLPPTSTSLPPTDTLVPPADTPLPPTETLVPPTETQAPPTNTSEPTIEPTATPPSMVVSGWIAFESQRDGNLEIYLYHADSLSEQRLTENDSDDMHLVWNSANDRMAFDSARDGNSEIYVMNRDGSGQTRLTDNPAQDSYPVWSPDGSRLAFLSNRDGNQEIYVMSADGADQTRVTDSPADECCLLWSPLGNVLAFIYQQNGAWGLYRMNPDGSDQTGLALASLSPFTWSPDGARLVFMSDRDGTAEIYGVNIDGTGETRLTDNTAQDTNPVWSPNGSLIAFLSNRDGNFEIYVMNPDGSNQIRLTSSSGNECCLVWSPDGMQLAFASDFEGNVEIYVVDIRNLSILRLTDNPAYDAPLAWRP